jgi:Rab11 family-interacting protein 1/2/5
VFHRNLLGLDEFLGQVEVPLDDLPVYERPLSRWYALRGKSGSGKPDKNRGELEVTATFIVQSLSQSQLSLSRSERSSSGGSGKHLSVKNLAHSIGKG